MSLMIDNAVIAGLKELERENSPGLLRDLVNLFGRRTPELIGEIEAGLTAKDSARISRAGHSLKSSCGNLGAMTMSRLGAELEAGARDFERSAASLRELKAEYEIVLRELREAAGL